MSHAAISSRTIAEMNRLRGVSAQARGNASEELVLEAALSAKDRIPGVLGARLHRDAEEDHRGIDVVVHTVDGDLLLQVKSSHREAALFRASRRGLVNALRIFVVVASFDRATMERRVDAAITAWRRQSPPAPPPAPGPVATGTPGYTAPEQARSAPASTPPRSPTSMLSPRQARRARHEALMVAEQAAKADRLRMEAEARRARVEADQAAAAARKTERAQRHTALLETQQETKGAKVAEELARSARRAVCERNRARNIALGIASSAQRKAMAAGEPPRCHGASACDNFLDGYVSAWRRAEDDAGICRACDEAMEALFVDLGWCSLAAGAEAA